MPELIAAIMPGERPLLVWLDYVRHNAPVRRLFRAARAHDVSAVWPEMDAANLDAGELLWIAQGLSAAGRNEDGLWLRARIAERSS